MKAFLHFGGAACGAPAGPFLTTSTDCRISELRHHRLGLQFTRTGYGARIPSPYMVRLHGKWRRVYVACFGNSGSAYVGKPGSWECTVDLESAQ